MIDVGKRSHLNEQEALAADIARVEARLNQGIVGAQSLDGDDVTGTGDRGSRAFGLADIFSDTPASEGAHFVHIKTPLRPDTNTEMFHFTMSGYLYEPGEVVQATVAGYCYQPVEAIINATFSGTHEPVDGSGNPIPAIYESSDGYVTLRLKVPTAYWLTMVVDCMKVGNGRLFIRGDLSIQISKSETI